MPLPFVIVTQFSHAALIHFATHCFYKNYFQLLLSHDYTSKKENKNYPKTTNFISFIISQIPINKASLITLLFKLVFFFLFYLIKIY